MLKIDKLLGEASNSKMDMKRIMFLLIFLAAAVVMFFVPYREWLKTAYNSGYYSHIICIPFVSAYLFYTKRKEIFEYLEYSIVQGSMPLLVGVILYAVGLIYGGELNKYDYTALMVSAGVVFIIGTFISVYGMRAFRSARFSLLFLFFLMPLPALLLDGAIRFLQVGSTEFVAIIFSLTGLPILREGFVFHLTGVSIEVAPACSGIRSSMALVITAVLAGHMFLKTTWKQIALVLAVLPITMFKNSIRIVTLSLLGSYVDRGYLESSLHRDGGVVFFVLALLLMAPILIVLRRGEKGA